jgi:Superinfection immunity protein
MHFLILVLLYFLPSIIAHRKQAFPGVLLLNVLLGWTVIGWFAALIWACTAAECHRVYAVASHAPGAARFCSRCGAMSHGVGSYCWNCGARV